MCRHLDLNFHSRVDESANQSCRRGADRAEHPAEHRHDCRPIRGFRYVIFHPYDIGETGARLGQRLLDVAERLTRLLGRILRDGHLRVIEAGGAGDENPLTINDGTAVPGLGLEI